MAEEKEQNTPQDEQPEAEQPVEAEAAAEAPAEEVETAAVEETPAAEERPEEPAGEEAAPAGNEPAAEAAEAPSAPAPPKPASSDDEEGPPSPKQLRKQEKSRFKGPAGPQRSVDDRVQERTESRSSKAQARSRWRRARREKQRSAAAGAPAKTPAAPSRPRGERKVRQGVVVSSKADKTITVRIDLVRSHRVYGKVVRNSGTLHAHDERNQANEGDVVRVVECRPLSRTKRWRLLDVLEKAR